MPDSQPEIDPDALASGARLGEFEIDRVLGIGGFGIVYLAFDHALERQVALKEYMPAALAARRGDAQITVRSQAHAKTFGIGLRSFVNEARLLARFDHPALVKVYRFWEDNGTAYMVMPYYEGQTLGSARAAMGSPPNEAWLLALADAVLGALEALHREQVYHRDVAPDNILLQPDGSVVLLDFGAARQVISDRTQSLTAILKPNFAPIEQYADSTQLRQGPWSDIYSLGAVLYFCIVGRAPMPAALRVLNDELPSMLGLREELAAADGSHYSEAMLAAIDAALAVRPEQRPQQAAQFRALLRGEALPAAAGLVALPAPAQTGAARAPARTAFAPTQALLRRLAVEPAVTTAWATLGPEAEARNSEQASPAGRPARAAAAALASLAALPRRRLAALGLAPVVLAGLIGYSSTRSESPPSVAHDGSRTAPTVPAVAAGPMPTSLTTAPAAAPTVLAPVANATPSVTVTPAGKPGPAQAPAPAAPRKAAATPSSGVPAERLRAAPRPVPEADLEDGEAVAAVVSEPARPEGVRRPSPAERRAATAREACGNRSFLPRLFCMQAQCNTAAFAQDPECIELRKRQGKPAAPLF